jgi:L-aminopeptidase/D-esterase-like protein
MSRVIASGAVGAGAGLLASLSHAVAGGSMSIAATATISGAAAVLFVIASFFTHRLSAVVAGVVAVQLLAHVWLESVHPHHGAASSHAHGLSGMLAHFFEPAMIMFGAHLVGFLVTVAVIACAKPLCESLLPVLFRWASSFFHAPHGYLRHSVHLSGFLYPDGVVSATDRGVRSPLRRRGPPVVV